jgi:hypothetical protein
MRIPRTPLTASPRTCSRTTSGQPVDGTSATFLPSSSSRAAASGDGRILQRPERPQAEEGGRKQALAAADCGVKVKKKETNKKKFRGKVLKQKKAPGTTAARHGRPDRDRQEDVAK